MAVLSRPLSCGCTRQVSPLIAPTKFRGGSSSLFGTVRTYLKEPSRCCLMPKVIDEVKEYFRPIFSNLYPYHIRDRLSDLRKSTSPGLHLRKLGRTKTEVLDNPKAQRKIRLFQHKIKTGKLRKVEPITQLVSADSKFDTEKGQTKSRDVWVVPLEVLAIENMFFASIKDRLPQTWVPKPATHCDLFCSYSSLSFDFTKFDSSVSRPLILMAFQIMREWFDFSKYMNHGVPYKRTSIARLWGFVRYYFIHTTFMCNGLIFKKNHGVPSGSMFTNIVDTICSRIVITSLHRINGCNATVCTYGDDCHSRSCTCEPDLLIRRACCMFDMHLKVEHPNEHGCLTYCKAECHRGVPFHPGLWYSNILNTCAPSLIGLVAYCLLFTEPTCDQYEYLLSLASDSVDIHPRLVEKAARIREHLATGDDKPSAL